MIVKPDNKLDRIMPMWGLGILGWSGGFVFILTVELSKFAELIFFGSLIMQVAFSSLLIL